MKVTDNCWNQYLKKYWVIENGERSVDRVTNPLIPDGYLEVLIIERNQATFKNGDTTITLSPGAFLTGQLDGKSEIHLAAGTKLHFLKLQPWSNLLISDFDFSEVTNDIIPLMELNKDLNQRIQDFNPSHQIAEICTNLISHFDEKSSINKNYNLLRACSYLYESSNSNYQQVKKRILEELDITSKTLETKFKRHIGVTPYQLFMTIRMRGVVEELIHNPSQTSLTSLAYKYGFFDQAHFIRSYRRLLNSVPSRICADGLLIPNSNEAFRYYTI